MNSLFSRAFLIFLTIALGTTQGLSLTVAGEKEKTSGNVNLKKGSRGLASVKPVSQGELMLTNVKTSVPDFLGDRSRSYSSLRVQGVCRDSYGMVFMADERGFADCIDAQNATRSGSSVQDYFGSAQRQAGVGVLVGK